MNPRILAIMGSGETAPTMARVHRMLFDRLGPGPVSAAILDTPYGFQANADQLSARTVEFFATNVGRPVTVASYRERGVDGVVAATAVARLREARYVMSGPGSPTYALRHWAGGPIPDALLAKLADGGIVVMASAAALTLGVATIPVYEIYKVGEAPHWLPGLNLLGTATGLRAAVVPHFDNAEGGNHDTRFCYVGERRLRVLEEQLPDDVFILGVDGHTALVLDLARGMASVVGLGGVTVRVGGRAATFPNGSEVPIEQLGQVARDLGAGRLGGAVWTADGSEGRAPVESNAGRPPAFDGAGLRDGAAEAEGRFLDALGRSDVREAVRVALDLVAAISRRLRAGEDSPDLDSTAAILESIIVRLGEFAERRVDDPQVLLDPFVSALLDVRARARSAKDWTTADLVRDRLLEAGVEVRDGEDESSWRLPAAEGQPRSR